MSSLRPEDLELLAKHGDSGDNGCHGLWRHRPTGRLLSVGTPLSAEDAAAVPNLKDGEVATWIDDPTVLPRAARKAAGG